MAWNEALTRRSFVGTVSYAAASVALAPVALQAAPACMFSGRDGDSEAVADAIRKVVIANRILAKEGVVDEYGHVSLRNPENPERFFISRSLSPAYVTPSDIMEFDLDGKVVGGDDRHPYLERFIHAAIYNMRPDIQAVAHAHAEEVLPFTVGSKRLRPVIHNAGVIGEKVPVWDMRDEFGDTSLLVVNAQQAVSLVGQLAGHNVVLMRGHGFSAAGRNMIELIRICVYLKLNAKVLLDALKLGNVKYLSPGEIQEIRNWDINSSAMQRAWIAWATQAGCEQLLSD